MSRGFTLIEMLVVTAIIGIITLVVIVSQGSFNKSLILSNAAYDLALALRSTESYGVSSRLSGPADTHLGYGLDFQPGSTFTFFADTVPARHDCHPISPTQDENAPDTKWGNCIYDLNQDAVITTYTIHHGITISSICAYYGNSTCARAARLDITFVRPDPSPFITKDGGTYDGSITSACLTLTSPQGGYKYVSVATTGEIDASAAPCP